MHDILIVSASVRKGKKSNRVAAYFNRFIGDQNLANCSILDLEDYHFPIFEERLQNLTDPPQNLITFSEKIKAADAILLVTPEYNGGYPASLKNAVDVLYAEWQRKPIAIATVSSGPAGGAQVLQQIQFVLWKIGAITVPVKFQVAHVEKNYTENGEAVHKEIADKIALGFVQGLLDAIPFHQGSDKPVK